MPLRPSFFNFLPSEPGVLAAKMGQSLAAIGEEALELIIALWILIVVERTYGQPGVGVYAYLTALLYMARYIADCGVARYMEHDVAIAHGNDSQQQRRMAAGFQASMVTGLSAALLLLATAGFDTAHTRIDERLAAYGIIALILPLANLNHLKLSILQGKGHHGRVARLSFYRYALILGSMLALTRAQVPPSFLLLAHLFSEVVMAFVLRRRLVLPGMTALWRTPHPIIRTLKQGSAYLFTDNGLDVLLNLDLFVLGLFVSSWDLGVYAEAAVIVRFFLVIPAGIKPILRRRYNLMAARRETTALFALVRHRTAVLFSLHAILAVCVLLTYPAVLHLFFQTRGEELLSFKLFAVFVPGLIFYGAFSAQEPLYEALGRMPLLRRLTMIASGINLVLTAYLVPFAGFYGAAVATMLTMQAYFGLFGRNLPPLLGLPKGTYLIGGLTVYLAFTLLNACDLGVMAIYSLAPLVVSVLFYAIGLFGVAGPAPLSEEASA
jgi:O-antigen/teichoic acid export membrane protein